MTQPRRSSDDQYLTETSDLQAETESILLKHIPLDPESPPPLQRQQHLQFLVRNLAQGFPSRYISQDASQPWLLYWTLQSFSVMGVVLDPNNKQRCVRPLRAVSGSVDTSGLSSARSTRFWHGSIRKVGLVVGQDRQHICFQPTLRSARLRSLADRGLEEAGIKSTGAFASFPFPFLTQRGIYDRKTLYAFFMSLKQPDGSFVVAHEAEIDVR